MACLVTHLCALLLCAGILLASAEAQITTRTDAVGQLLNQWHAAGTAAGLNGFVYENRDKGHSMLDFAAYPQLKLYEATEEEKGKDLHFANASQIRSTPTFGNSSMAGPVTNGGSLPRFYFLTQNGYSFLANQYFNNNLFFYPEHQDYDEGYNGRGGWGDMYVANTPYLIISQGSSFSDKPFLQAFVSAAAALHPDVQTALVRSKILMPTLQALFRRSNKQVQSEEDYFSPQAHPTVFQGTQIDEEKLVRLAHDLTTFSLPPLTMIEVVKEDAPQYGKDFFEADPRGSEKLGDSPCAIARIFRGSAKSRNFVITARKSVDPRRRPLTFKWALLQGDPKRVKIQSTMTGDTATIEVNWQPAVKTATGINSHRVDIGVFASNGVSWSAPAFVSIYMLPNEARTYGKNSRVEEICYQADNPDLGLPAADNVKWLAFAQLIASKEGNIAVKRLRQAMSKPALNRLADLAGESGALDNKGEANPALKGKIRQVVSTQLAAKDDNTLQSAVEAAITIVADDPDLFVEMQDSILAAAKSSPKPKAVEEIETGRQRLLDWKVYRQPPGKKTALCCRPKAPSPGERYLLRMFHLTVLSEALLPDFLDRSPAPAFVDNRLTAAKPWRDIYHYSGDGKCTGWTRMVQGREYEFDNEGRLFPEGKKGVPAVVKYKVETKGGLLLFSPE